VAGQAGGGSIETRFGWAVVFASLPLITIGSGSTLLLVVSLKQVAIEFGWPRSVPSLAYALNMIGIGLGGIIMGWWSERNGMTGPLLLATVAMAVGLWIVSQATTQWEVHLAYGLFIGFLANGALFAPLVANTTRWFDRRRGMAVALVASGQAIGGTFWAPLFRYINETEGWRTTYTWYAILAACVMPPLILVLRRWPPIAPMRARAPGDDGRVLGLAPDLVNALLFVAIISCCVAMAMPLVQLVAHVSDIGFSMARGAEVLALILAVSFFSRFGLGTLSDRVGGFRTLLFGSSLQAMALVLFIFVRELWAIYSVAVLFGLGYGGIVPSYAIIVREIFPERGAAWRMAIVFLGGTLGMAIGGWLGGYIFDRTGSYADAFLTGLAFNIANLALVSTLFRRQRRERHQHAFAAAVGD
jgi:MFS family permease